MSSINFQVFNNLIKHGTQKDTQLVKKQQNGLRQLAVKNHRCLLMECELYRALEQ